MIDTGAELTTRFERDALPLLAGLYGHAMKLTRNHADAEDLLQDTAANAFAGFGTFRDGTNLGGWLCRILLNSHVNRYRKQQRSPAYRLTDHITDAQMAEEASHSAGGLRSAEDQILDMLADNQIKAAMEALPEQLRTAVYYADVEGRRCREIAELMGTPIGTVMSRVHRGRRRLRILLADVAKDRGYRLPQPVTAVDRRAS